MISACVRRLCNEQRTNGGQITNRDQPPLFLHHGSHFDRLSGLRTNRTKQELRQFLVAAVFNGARSVIANFEGAKTRSAAHDDGRV